MVKEIGQKPNLYSEVDRKALFSAEAEALL